MAIGRVAGALSMVTCAMACGEPSPPDDAAGATAASSLSGGAVIDEGPTSCSEDLVNNNPDGGKVSTRSGTVVDADWSGGPVVINEIRTDGAPDFIELYNRSPGTRHIGGWSIHDYYTDGVPKDPPGTYTLPRNVYILGGDYLILSRQDGCVVDTHEFIFGLGTRDEVHLHDAAGREVDRLDWGASTSFGRYPDGTECVGPMRESTRNMQNQEHCHCCVACRGLGLCDRKGDSCVASGDLNCRESQACMNKGWCAVRGDVCRAATDEHCAASTGCRNDGRCALDNDGLCGATTDGLCRTAPICTERGRCSAQGGKCVASTDADCRKSVDCEKKSRCSLSGDRCVAVDCASSEICLEKGCCTLEAGRCVKFQ